MAGAADYFALLDFFNELDLRHSIRTHVRHVASFLAVRQMVEGQNHRIGFTAIDTGICGQMTLDELSVA